MADDQLTIKISADTSAASAPMSQVIALLTQMEADLAAMGAAGKAGGAAVAEGQNVAAEATAKHAEAESVLGATLGRVEYATTATARALGALGLNAGEASERVLALTEALDGLGAAAAPLIVLGGALLAVAAAVGYVGEGLKEASKWQVEMTSVGQAVADQGGDWKTAQGGLQEYLKTLEEGTTFSQGEALSAIRSLTTAGISLGDSEKIVAVATDVAAAKGISLAEVVDRIKEAEAGRAMGLVQLDENLKGVIKSHGTLQDVLDVLAHDMAGQSAAATQTLDGKYSQIKNTLDETAKEIALHLLPELITGADLVLLMAHNFEENAPKIESAIDGWVSHLDQLIGFLHDTWTAVTQLTDAGVILNAVLAGPGTALTIAGPTPARHGLVDYLPGAGTALDSNGLPAAVSPQAVDPAVAAIHKAFKDGADYAAHALDGWNKLKGSAESRPLDSNPVMGNEKAGGSGPSTFESTPDALAGGVKTDGVLESGKALDEQLKLLTGSEGLYRAAVDLATTSDQKAAAEKSLAAKVTSDATIASDMLNDAIAEEQQHLNSLTSALPAQRGAYEAARASYDAYRQSLVGGGKETDEQKQHLADLKAAMDGAEKTFKSTTTTVADLKREIQEHTQALAEAKVKTEALSEYTASLERTYNGASAAQAEKIEADKAIYGKSIADQLTYWNQKIAIEKTMGDAGLQKLAEYEAKRNDLLIKEHDDAVKYAKDTTAEKQQLADEEATYNLSLAQQVEYYQRRLAALLAAGDIDYAAAEKIQQKLVQLETDEFKQREDAHTQFVKDIQSKEETLLDDLVTKNESFSKFMKSIWDDMLKSMEEDLVKSSLFSSFNNSIAKVLGVPGGPNSTQTDPQIKLDLNATAQSLTESGAIASGITTADTNAQSGIQTLADLLHQILAALQAGASDDGGPGALPGLAPPSLVDFSSQAASQYGILGATIGATGASTILPSLPTSGGLASLFIGSGWTSDPGQMGAGAGGSWDSNTTQTFGASVGTTAGSYITSAIQGAGIGAAVGSLDGGNQSNASIGGALGGLLGMALHANPLIGAGIDVAASLIGSLFGDHFSQASEPDIYGEPEYGQGVANLTGKQAGANGVTYNPTSAVMTATGNQGEISTIEEALAAGKPGWMTDQEYQQYISTFGESSTGGGKLNFGVDDANQWITGATGASTTPTNYNTLDQMAASFMQSLQDNPQAVPVFTISRTYPNFAGTLGADGTFSPNAVNMLQQVAAGASGSSGSAAASGASGASTQGGVNVTVNFSGTVVGSDGMVEFTQIIARNLRRLDGGEMAGGYTNQAGLGKKVGD